MRFLFGSQKAVSNMYILSSVCMAVVYKLVKFQTHRPFPFVFFPLKKKWNEREADRIEVHTYVDLVRRQRKRVKRTHRFLKRAPRPHAPQHSQIVVYVVFAEAPRLVGGCHLDLAIFIPVAVVRVRVGGV